MWIKNLPKPLTDRRSEILLHHARQGNNAAKLAEKLIRGHLRVAVKVANTLKTENEAKNSDILGVALLTLVECVKKIVDPEKELTTPFHTGPWLYHRMRWAIKDFLRHDRLSVMHPDTYMSELAKGNQPAGIILVDFDNVSMYNHKAIKKSSSHNTDIRRSLQVNRRNTLDIREALSLAVIDDRERDIVEMLGCGDNLTDIGEKLNLSRERVRQIVNQIRERLIDFKGDYTTSRRRWARQRDLEQRELV